MWVRRAWGGVTFYAVLAGLQLLPVPLVAVAWAFGAFATPLERVLAVLLAIAVGGLLALVSYSLGLRGKIIRTRELLSPQTRAHVWFGGTNDVLRFSVRPQDFEAALFRASETARAELGEDAVTWFKQMSVVPAPDMMFAASGKTAQKSIQILVRGPTEDVTFTRFVAGHVEEPDPVYPWREDTSYTELVTKSWLRMRPFKGMSLLAPSYRWSHGLTEEGESAWYVSYVHLGDLAPGPDPAFTLKDGELADY